MTTAITIMSGDQLEKAIACNRFYHRSSSAAFPPAQFASLDPESAIFAAAVARWQRDHALNIDGILGPKTAAALQGRTWKSPKGENYLIVKGEKVPTSFPVVHWTHPEGFSFERVIEAIPDFNGVGKRANPTIGGIERFVIHWDECTSSHDCFHVLLWRGLSVQLFLDSDGTLYQGMDLVNDLGRHARWTNETSVGIEINNPVTLRKTYNVQNRKIVRAQEPHTADPNWRHLDYTEVQKSVMKQLVPAICDALEIPRTLPQDDSGEVPKGLIPDPTEYKGVMGHYHLQTDKVDPGYTLWPLLLKVL
ncbi:negative regulator of beta-lactamase expression protein [Grosmannia clavigera kw1407]|uniref:Negative regulator of beta-lactamase expression protein n=1 Tax=Grosmannia clavigera (strain kw1407 / UAMH 11150) TaxID=655863 RepID=F0XBI0_GROCL|nr:negative regulator of beta-lactamase expression protein [Grosmannia clavigera kw1407]EFX04988.1 negative regulator of beta-lactamase expression protein [Grosmannia clavigera kw1407]